MVSEVSGSGILAKCLPPLNVVEVICENSDEEISDLAHTLRPPSWGQTKGGLKKIARYGCNLTLEDRVKGGRRAGRSNSVDHMTYVASIGAASSLKSNRNPRRHVTGPNGILMYIKLEKDVYELLLQSGLSVEYEPIVRIGIRRIAPDFRIGRIYVECTCEPKASIKAASLSKKFELLNQESLLEKAIVVTPPYLVGKHRFYLEAEVSVVSIAGLVGALADGPGEI